jgi:serine/threonine protein phosphatase PrpC
MGCAGGKANNERNVEQGRRRLSVGHVDKENAESTDTNSASEDDRGLITSLNEKNIVEMLEQQGETGGRKMSIGSNTDQGKTSFANKKIDRIGDELDPAQCGMGYTCRKGLKPESPNQDSWFVLKMEKLSIYAVFDGHGQKGHDVSQFVKENLPKLIIKDPRHTSDADVAKCLVDSFKKMQNLVFTADKMKKLSAQMSGTTASVVVHNHVDKKLTFAHVADSTIVLGTKEGSSWKVAKFTEDHKPNLKQEKARIEKAGGRVVFDGYANHRVYAKNARYPGLNMSRCLGDLLGHQDCGISCEPEINQVEIAKECAGKESILLLCSDGVWEFITHPEALAICGEFKEDKAMQAAEKLAKEAWDRWIKEEGGAVVDDITVVLVHVKAD